jgi:hypothetical protein
MLIDETLQWLLSSSQHLRKEENTFPFVQRQTLNKNQGKKRRKNTSKLKTANVYRQNSRFSFPNRKGTNQTTIHIYIQQMMMDVEPYKAQLDTIYCQLNSINDGEINENLLQPIISSLEEKLNTAKSKLIEMEQINSILSITEVTEINGSKIKSNIGGKKFDIKRTTLEEHEQKLGFLSLFLLSPKWEEYLLKDKNNRIYFDYDLDWLENIVKIISLGTLEWNKLSEQSDEIIHQLNIQRPDEEKNPHDYDKPIYVAMLQLFNDSDDDFVEIFEKLLELYFSTPLNQIPLKLLFSSRVEDLSDLKIANLAGRIDSSEDIQDGRKQQKSDRTICDKEKSINENTAESELKEISIILMKPKSDEMFCIITDQRVKPNHAFRSGRTIFYHFSDRKLDLVPDFKILDSQQDVSEKSKNHGCIFPLHFSRRYRDGDDVCVDNPGAYNTSFSLILEKNHLSICPGSASLESRNFHHSDTCVALEELLIYTVKNSQQLNDVTLSSVKSSNYLEKLRHVLNTANHIEVLIETLMNEMKETEEVCLQNLHLICNFFYKLWSKIIQSFPSLKIKENTKSTFNNDETDKESILNEVLYVCSYLDSTLTVIKDYKASVKENVNLDPIAYLNVEGERICILKSTLQEMIPNSQLAIRLASGRWEEQLENLDEDGNIIIDDVAKHVIQKLFHSMRTSQLTNQKKKQESKLEIPVTNKKEKEIFLSAFDYLLINNFTLIDI